MRTNFCQTGEYNGDMDLKGALDRNQGQIWAQVMSKRVINDGDQGEQTPKSKEVRKLLKIVKDFIRKTYGWVIGWVGFMFVSNLNELRISRRESNLFIKRIEKP